MNASLTFDLCMFYDNFLVHSIYKKKKKKKTGTTELNLTAMIYNNNLIKDHLFIRITQCVVCGEIRQIQYQVQSASLVSMALIQL